MNLLGEHWIHDGTVTYCDGDVGDMNHEGVVVDHVRHVLADLVGMEVDYLAALAEGSGWPQGFVEQAVAAGAVDWYLDAARGVFGLDLRQKAIMEWGWHAVRLNLIETRVINDRTVAEIKDGIWEILGDLPKPSAVFWICEYEGDRKILLTGAQVETDEWDADWKEAPCGPNAAVAQMDKEMEPDFYKK